MGEFNDVVKKNVFAFYANIPPEWLYIEKLKDLVHISKNIQFKTVDELGTPWTLGKSLFTNRLHKPILCFSISNKASQTPSSITTGLFNGRKALLFIHFIS